MKTYDITSPADRDANPDIQTHGSVDDWVLICKAWNNKEGWMKSTKARQMPYGCLVQVSTQQGDNVAEALTFVPGVRVHDLK